RRGRRAGGGDSPNATYLSPVGAGWRAVVGEFSGVAAHEGEAGDGGGGDEGEHGAIAGGLGDGAAEGRAEDAAQVHGAGVEAHDGAMVARGRALDRERVEDGEERAVAGAAADAGEDEEAGDGEETERREPEGEDAEGGDGDAVWSETIRETPPEDAQHDGGRGVGDEEGSGAGEAEVAGEGGHEVEGGVDPRAEEHGGDEDAAESALGEGADEGRDGRGPHGGGRAGVGGTLGDERRQEERQERKGGRRKEEAGVAGAADHRLAERGPERVRNHAGHAEDGDALRPPSGGDQVGGIGEVGREQRAADHHVD